MFQLEHTLTNSNKGLLGQKIAIKYLQTRDYKIIACNLRINHDEIDILANNKGKNAFIEVKSRFSSKYEKASYHFSAQKIFNLKRSALAYAQQNSFTEDSISLEGIAVDINMSNKRANIRHFKSLI